MGDEGAVKPGQARDGVCFHRFDGLFVMPQRPALHTHGHPPEAELPDKSEKSPLIREVKEVKEVRDDRPACFVILLS